MSRFVRRCTAAAAVPAALLLVLSGCSGSGAGQAAPATASPETNAASAAPGPAPELPARYESVETALTELLASNSAPSREAVREAYASAGFSPETVEVSQDGTPTGLAVDSIVAAAPDGADCIVGEIRDGKLALATVPALANGKCLLGDDR